MTEEQMDDARKTVMTHGWLPGHYANLLFEEVDKMSVIIEKARNLIRAGYRVAAREVLDKAMSDER